MSRQSSPPPRSKKTVKPLVSDTIGLTLLGAGSLPQVEKPSTALLETFASPAPQRHYEICFSSSEFTSICPITGQPDYATITIRYVPQERCIESKALKLYLHSFRNQGVFAESIVNRILDDLVEVLMPRKITVTGEFAPRGGISLRVEANYTKPFSKLADASQVQEVSGTQDQLFSMQIQDHPAGQEFAGSNAKGSLEGASLAGVSELLLEGTNIGATQQFAAAVKVGKRSTKQRAKKK